ncbi:MAG: hypothetical protein JWN41_1466, partial [Thermoleophilia bacterium]|nr:hypothetical protein [Thermoleophilia bacterium]
ICFDADAARMQDAVVLEPEPTAAGLVRAFDQAFAVSVHIGRPVLVLIRDRMLGMRGTIQCRAELAPRAAAERDAMVARPMELPVAAAVCGLVQGERGAGPRADQDVIVTVGALARSVRRAVSYIDTALAAAGHTPVGEDVALLVLDAAGVTPAGAAVDALLPCADRVLVVDAPHHHLSARLIELAPGSAHERAAHDAETVRGEDITATIARWMLQRDELTDAAAAVLSAIAMRVDDASLAVRSVARRIPRRNARFNRAVSPSLAAGLALAQGVIGVPGRLAPEYPTYQADTGVPLTIVPSEVFVEFGLASAAPQAGVGVFVVTGSGAGVAEQAARCHASIELVDGVAPRAIGRAIAHACLVPRQAPHVIIVSEIQRVAAPRAACLGLDPELLATDRLATAAVPPTASVLVDLDDELLAGPVEIVLDAHDAVAVLDHVRELSPATWDLTVQRRAGSSRFADAMWGLRRRLVRSVSGVDL